MKLEYIIKTIEKDLEERTTKHPVTERAINIGKTGVMESNYSDGIHRELDRISYSDGTQIIMEEGEIKRVITPEGNSIDYYSDDGWTEYNELGEPKYGQGVKGYEFFSGNQGDKVDSLDSEEFELMKDTSNELTEYFYDSDYSRMKEAIEDIMQDPKVDLANVSDKDIEKRMKIIENSEQNEDGAAYGGDWDKIKEYSLKKFPYLLKENSFENSESFITQNSIKDLPTDEGTNKGIVQNKGIGYEYSHDTYEQSGTGTHFTQNEWNIITIREKGNPANKGIQREATGPLESQPFLSAPGAKFERLLIDKDRKIIIQRPYQPGMDRKIWG